MAMWSKKQSHPLPKVWSKDLWDRIFGTPTFRLIVDRYRFRSMTGDTTRVLGEPGEVSIAFRSESTNPISHVERKYAGRLELDGSHPASAMPVYLTWNTDRQMVGAQEWWHWGYASIPRQGVYGWMNPVQLDGSIELGITLGTDSPGEALFEQIFLRSMMAAAGPLIVHGQMSSLPIEGSRIGIVSEYSVEHSIGSY